ncbi:hypothetical protein BU25DRAFT_143924 [Macroventuria anomochaeta]|uniref:Uncharacterized protein n=1 Tax=Macroventuria anomochaeta TaxID=301207 RepID=A0ACB6SDC3_9PLEO|nr:uncharacterized protein BU25DRAFT_143924 [Macroventuria anomochaeta]KAF2632221.1 hypothetical protein BU25DRAFT_143924 [Macroventuria anomochaeta]
MEGRHGRGRRSHHDAYHNYDGSIHNPDTVYDTETTTTGNSSFEHPQTMGRNRFVPPFGVNGSDQVGVRPMPRVQDCQYSDSNVQVASSTFLQTEAEGFANQVSSITFGMGGHAYTTAGPPYATNNVTANEPSNVPNYYAHRHDCVDSQSQSNNSDGFVNPRFLTLSVEDYDELQAGVRQETSAYPDNPNLDAGSDTPFYIGDVPGLHGDLDTSQPPQGSVSRSISSDTSLLLFDQMTANMPLSPVPAPMPTELGDVPFAQTRRQLNMPWSTEQSRLDVAYDEGTFNRGQQIPSTRVTSSGSHSYDQSWMSDMGYVATADTSWDPGAIPTNPDAAAHHPLPFVMHQPASMHAFERRHSLQPHVSGPSQDPWFENPSLQEDIGPILDNLHIDGRSGPASMTRLPSDHLYAPDSTLFANSPTSPTPSEVSMTPSVVRASLMCHIGGCHVLFTGQYRRGNLARHIRLVHNRREFPCGVIGCNRIFKRQDALKKHFDKKHRGR